MGFPVVHRGYVPCICTDLHTLELIHSASGVCALSISIDAWYLEAMFL